MKIKVSELTGRPLDYAVAVAMGGEGLWHDTIATWWIKIDGIDRALSKGWARSMSFHPSTDPAQSYPIIEREKIQSGYIDTFKEWECRMQGGHRAVGPTALIAAMRCYVASKLGEEVDIPKGLA